MRVKQIASKCTTIFALCFIAVSMILLAGCGSDSSDSSVPNGGTVTVTSHTQTGIASDTPVNFLITTRYADATPMPFANVKVSGPFAAPRTPIHYYQFYLFPDATFRHGGNTPVDSGFTIQTENDGTYMFSVLISAATGTFGDVIEVISGTARGTGTIVVN